MYLIHMFLIYFMSQLIMAYNKITNYILNNEYNVCVKIAIHDF